MNMMRRRKNAPVEFDTEPKTEADKALHESLRSKLREIVEKPLTVRGLVELAEMAQLTHQIIIAGKMPRVRVPGDMNVGAQEIIGMSGYGSGYATSNPMYSDDELSVMAPSSSAETFGASAIREMVAAIGKMKEKKESPAEIVKAIAAAKESGLDDVAAKLEAKLFGEPEPTQEQAAAEEDRPFTGGEWTGDGDVPPGIIEGASVLVGGVPTPPAPVEEPYVRPASGRFDLGDGRIVYETWSDERVEPGKHTDVMVGIEVAREGTGFPGLPETACTSITVERPFKIERVEVGQRAGNFTFDGFYIGQKSQLPVVSKPITAKVFADDALTADLKFDRVYPGNGILCRFVNVSDEAHPIRVRLIGREVQPDAPRGSDERELYHDEVVS